MAPRLARQERWPLNTSGGQLSAGQAGAAGGMHGLVTAPSGEPVAIASVLLRSGPTVIARADCAYASDTVRLCVRDGALIAKPAVRR